MKYLSLFTGIGGFELGFQQAYEEKEKSNNEYAHIGKKSEQKERSQGRKRIVNQQGIQLHPRNRSAPFCVGYSEIDKYAIQVFEKHFPIHKNFGDITKIKERELPDFDLICGGFPCQSFSIAGKRGGFEDTRGTLFFDIARIIKFKRPRIVFLENVKGLLSHDDGRTFNTIILTLDELGYDIQWQVLNSKNFGVPQNRERVFIIGHLRGTPRPKVFPFKGEGETITKEPRVVGNTNRNQRERGNVYADDGIVGALTATDYKQPKQIQQLNQPKHSNNRVYGEGGISPTLNTAQGGNRQPKVVQPVKMSNMNMQGRRIKNDGEESFTLGSGSGCENGILQEMKVANTLTPDAYLTSGKRKRVNGKAVLTSMYERKIRRLTPIECERLQGFPDGWTGGLSDTQRYKTLGNAVTVNVIKAIAERLAQKPIL